MEKPASVISMFTGMAAGLFSDKQNEEEIDLEMESQRTRLRKRRRTEEADMSTVASTKGSDEPRRESLLLHHRLGKRSRLIAYTRCGGCYHEPAMQRYVIKTYAEDHGYVVSDFYDADNAFAVSNLSLAFDALINADGLIVSDLNRLVGQCADPARELVPLIHDNFFHNDRYLISVQENINTSTAQGQNALLHYVHQLLRAA